MGELDLTAAVEAAEAALFAPENRMLFAFTASQDHLGGLAQAKRLTAQAVVEAVLPHIRQALVGELAAAMTAHQRRTLGRDGCSCGWYEPGANFSMHVLDSWIADADIVRGEGGQR